MSTVLFSVISILLLIINNVNSDNCNLKEQTCSNENEHCIFQRANLGYPDPKNFYTINPPAYVETTDYTCNTQAYCEWAELMNVSCIQIYVPEKFFSSAFPTPDGKCSVIKAPITINETISCCQKNMNCSNVFTNLDEEPLNRSTWAYKNCPLRPDLTEIVEDVVDCYATIEFMKYIKCNESDYAGQCPDYWFKRLQTYARCSCQVLKTYEDAGLKNSLYYFNELTEMIEGIFQSFRGDDKENCPPWSFSCDAEGDAVLEVNEIVCPLDLDPDRFDYSSNIGLADDIIYDSDSSTYLEGIRTKIYDGLGALVDQQVTIDTSSTNVTLRVLMYSEQDAMDAADWLSLNTTEDLPDEVDSKRCRLNDEALQINLNEVYGDITPSPTDSCCQIKIIFALFFICIISLLL